MDIINTEAANVMQPVGKERLLELTRILLKYKSGKSRTDERIRSSEKWWKLRNQVEERKETSIGKDGGFVAKSAWLHNTIVSKHADAMEAYPEPNILPREPSDRESATQLSAIIPCVLEQNHFESTYSDVMWQKLKTGTGLYKIVWDSHKHNGLGDIAVERVNLLNVFWEPGVTDIQRSRYFFHVELQNKDSLIEAYPELEGKLNSRSMIASEFDYDDPVDETDMVTVIECYYHKLVGQQNTLQYVRYIGTEILYSTENDPEMAERGLYDHGMYPYVFDTMYPIEGSPCGYGFVDVCRNPQTEMDVLQTAIVKNAVVAATPRYFIRGESGINEKEFLDLSKPIVHATSGVGDEQLRRIDTPILDSDWINLLDRITQELRETSGNTESASGVAPSGVTAASAIAALQEAAGRTSRDATLTSYRAFGKVVEFCIELIRQFYDIPRKFRITGQYGAESYVTYTNENIKPQYQGAAFGMDLGYRTPVFDVKISAQKKSVYTKVSQNELALQFYQLGFFNPNTTDQTLLCLEMMDFDGKDEIAQKVAKNGTMAQKLIQYINIAAQMAQTAAPQMLPMIQQDMAMMMGTPVMASKPVERAETESGEEHPVVEKSRQRANDAVQPVENREVIG